MFVSSLPPESRPNGEAGRAALAQEDCPPIEQPPSPEEQRGGPPPGGRERCGRDRACFLLGPDYAPPPEGPLRKGG